PPTTLSRSPPGAGRPCGSPPWCTWIVRPSRVVTRGTSGSYHVVESRAMSVTVVNPATEERIAELEQAGGGETEAAGARAKEAFPAWRDLAPNDRARLLRQLATLV